MGGARLLPVGFLVVAVGCSRGPGAGCDSCTIERVPIARLDFRNAPASPNLAPVILALAAGQGYLVAPKTSPGDLFLFDAQGRYVRSIGRPGAGPGEHHGITAMTRDATDSIWVFDPGNHKVDVYGPDLEHARTLQVAGIPNRALALPGRGILLQGLPGDARSAGPHTWLLQPSGDTRPTAAPPPDEEAATGLQSMALEGPDAVWVVEGHRFQAILLSLTGDTIRSIGEAPAWFKASADADKLGGMLDTRPAVMDITRSAGGILWLLVGVFQATLPDPATLNGVPPDRVLDRFVDHVLVALDNRTGAPLAEMRFDYLPGSFVGPGLLAALEDDAAGERWVQIYRLEVAGLK